MVHAWIMNFTCFTLKVKIDENEMLFYLWKGKNAVQAVKETCTIYGDGAKAENSVSRCSEEEIWIWKTKTILAGLQSMIMIKYK